MNKLIRDFFRSHPRVVELAKQLEHAGFDAAEEMAVNLVASKLGFLGKVLPVQAIADAGKAVAEGAIDGMLSGLEGAPPAPIVPLFAPAPAAPDAPANGQTNPTMIAKQAARRQAQIDLADSIDAGDRAAPGQRGVTFVPVTVE